jgi:hypothetical protein
MSAFGRRRCHRRTFSRRGLITFVIVRISVITIGISSEERNEWYRDRSRAVVSPFHRLDNRDSGCDCMYCSGFRIRTLLSYGYGRRNRCFESIGGLQFDIARGRLDIFLMSSNGIEFSLASRSYFLSFRNIAATSYDIE